jgi:uncharacterized phage protein gp47/JayE
MAGFTIKQFDDIVSDMVAYIIANSSSITDLSPGSVIRSFVEGSALSIEEVYVGIYLGFRRYLDNVQETAFDFERKDGTKAIVNEVFSRAAANGLINIPIGSRVKTPSGLRFLTTIAGTIDAGQTDSASVACEAENTGSAYNIGSATLTILEDSIAGIDTITNALAATGGVNQESNIAYKTRFQAFIEGLGRSNIAGLIAGALSVEGITSVSIVELFPPVGNVNVDLYVDDGSAVTVTADKILEVQGIIDGDGTEDNPGYRSAGVNVVVKAPSIVTQNITMEVEILSGIDTDQLETDLVDAVSAYINTLGVGVDIIYNEIIAAVMSVYGIVDVDLTVPSVNVTVAATQVGRAGTILVSVA